MIKNLLSNCKWFFDMRALQRAADIKPFWKTANNCAMYHKKDECTLTGTNPLHKKSIEGTKTLLQAINPGDGTCGKSLFNSFFILTTENIGVTRLFQSVHFAFNYYPK